MADPWPHLAARKAELDRLRPLAPHTLAVLARWYDVELTYTSTAIEGNTLTRSETALLLEKGLTIGGKPLRDHLEVIDHQSALDYVRALAGRNEALREGDVREIHRLVLGRTDPNEAGRYSRHQRAIAGSPLRLPAPAELPALMGDFGQWLAAAEASPQTAFAAHLRLVTIHPFGDGNGRTARLLMNLLLLKCGYPPVAIGPEQRAAYVAALQRVQVDGDGTEYEALLLVRLVASLDHHIGMAAGDLGAAAP